MDGTLSENARRIALLAGGDSAEREISLASGQQVAIALALAGYEPVLIDPAEIELDAIDWPSFDVCFIALHGGAGEDGRVQRQLERWNIPYTGSDSAASRLAMSKAAAKQKFLECGVPTLPFVAIEANQQRLDEPLMLGFPLVIKPESQGSSLGVAIANRPEDLQRCIAMSAEFGRKLMAEPFVAGREFTVSLLGRDPLPMIEIISPQPVFTYDAKYSNPNTNYRFEFSMPAAVERELYDAATNAAEALGTACLTRVDLMLDRDHRPWVLEVNTIPGMTARSLAPLAARAAGLEMPTLVDWMVRDAIHRHQTPSAFERRTLTEPMALSERDCL